MKVVIKFFRTSKEEFAAIREDFHDDLVVDPPNRLLGIAISVWVLLENKILLIVGQSDCREVFRDLDYGSHLG